MFDLINATVWRRSARGETDGLGVVEPLFAQVVDRLHVMHAAAIAAAGLHQLMGIVAVRAADHDHHV